MSTYYTFEESVIEWNDRTKFQAAVKKLKDGFWLDSNGFWLDEAGERLEPDAGKGVSHAAMRITIPRGDCWQNLGRMIPELVEGCSSCDVTFGSQEEESYGCFYKHCFGDSVVSSRGDILSTDLLDAEARELHQNTKPVDAEGGGEFDEEAYSEWFKSLLEVIRQEFATVISAVEENILSDLEDRFLVFPGFPDDRVAVLLDENEQGQVDSIKLIDADPDMDYALTEFCLLQVDPTGMMNPQSPETGAFWHKDWSELRAISGFLRNEGLLELTGRTSHSGFVIIKEVRPTDKLRKIAFRSMSEIEAAAELLRADWQSTMAANQTVGAKL